MFGSLAPVVTSMHEPPSKVAAPKKRRFRSAARRAACGALLVPMLLVFGGFHGVAQADETASDSSPDVVAPATQVAPQTAPAAITPPGPPTEDAAAPESARAGARSFEPTLPVDPAPAPLAEAPPAVVATVAAVSPAASPDLPPVARAPGSGSTEPATSGSENLPGPAPTDGADPLTAPVVAVNGASPTATASSAATGSQPGVSPELLPIPLGAVSTSAAGDPVDSAATPARLGTSGDFAILGGSTVTNTGATTITGDVGLHPGSAVTGFAPCTPPAPANCVALTGALHVADGAALQAQSDQLTAYNALVGLESTCTPVAVELAGNTFLPGTYCSPGTFNLSAGGILMLDAQGNPDAEFIFLTGTGGTTLITGAGSQVLLVGSAQACHVYWQVASSATIGVSTAFVGTILAAQSIQLQTGATLEGRAFARTGAVTLDTNRITRGDCATTPVVTPPVTTAPGGTPTAPVVTPPVTTSPATPGVATPRNRTRNPVTARGGTPRLVSLEGTAPGPLSGRPAEDLASTGAHLQWQLLIAGAMIGVGQLMRHAARPRRSARSTT